MHADFAEYVNWLGSDSECCSCSDEGNVERFRVFPVLDDCWAMKYPGRCWQPDDPGSIMLRGWASMGYTYNAERAPNRGNGPVGYNDRADEFQLNQLYAYLHKPLDENYDGLQYGFRADMVFGTDARYMQAIGLELDQDTALGVSPPLLNYDLNSGRRFYHLAFPQFYGEVGYGCASLLVGHFYSPIGYERGPADENFFYSHSYARIYGEPLTHTGALAKAKIGDRLTFRVGLHNGWDNFTHQNAPINDQYGILAGATITNASGNVSFSFDGIVGDSTDFGSGNIDPQRQMYSMVLKVRLTDDLTYVAQHDAAYQEFSGINEAVQWYGLVQYLYMTLTDNLQAGIRYEVFDDDDAVRVAALDRGNVASVGAYSGWFHAITAGLNWMPCENVRIRPELRWDWFANHNVQTGLPFGDDGAAPFPAATERSQFTAALDAIILW